jgi:hypothetical protein
MFDIAERDGCGIISVLQVYRYRYYYTCAVIIIDRRRNKDSEGVCRLTKAHYFCPTSSARDL